MPRSSFISLLGILMGAIIFKPIQHPLVILKISDNGSDTLRDGLIPRAIIVDRARAHSGGTHRGEARR